MNLRALSIGEAVPHEDFEAVTHSVFETAVNFRLKDEDRLITLLVSQDYELPQGIRIWTKGPPFHNLTPGLHAALKGGILRFASSPLTVNLHNTPVWKSRIPELNLDMRISAVQQAWSNAWDLLNKVQRGGKTGLVADDLLEKGTGSTLSQRISHPLLSLVASAEGLDLPGALRASEKIVGLGPGVTPSGDDVLIGFLAGLWSTAGQTAPRLAFLRSFGTELIQIASQTSEISRTYIFHAAHGQFSSALSNLAESIGVNKYVDVAARSAMRVGHSSGMDAVTGLLIGLRVWN